MPSHKILILGNCHIDFTPYTHLKFLFNKYKELNKPIIFMEELPCNENIDQLIKTTEQVLEQTLSILKIPQLSAYRNQFITDPFAAQPVIFDLLKQAFPHWGDGLVDQVTLKVLGQPASKEALTFYHQLKKLDVPYFGIENAHFSETMIEISGNSQAFIEKENSRVSTMSHNIKANLKKLTENTLIVVWVGNHHARRLAAHLALNSNNENYSINSKAFEIVSNYSINFNAYRDKFRADSHQIDSIKVQQYYEANPCLRINCDLTSSKTFHEEIEFFIDDTYSAVENSFSNLSLFSNPVTDLKKTIEDYLQTKPDSIHPAFINAIAANKFSQAFRQACANGNIYIAELLLKNRKIAAIDVFEQSSNGNTALSWWNLSTVNFKIKVEFASKLKDIMDLEQDSSIKKQLK